MPDVYSNIDFASSTKFERMFLARRGARRLGNQDELETLASRYGYATVFMEDYSVLEQLSIGAQAKHVIAIHGAAMSFLVMSKKILSVIELMPPNVYHEFYPVCLGAKVGCYQQIIPDFDPAVAHSGWSAVEYFKNRPFSVDIRLLDRLFRELH
jgi:capsular polysaccharide biosynthesis protein